MTAVVLQARLDSVRLPGKSLLPLGDKPLILVVMEALRKLPVDRYILACPDDCTGFFGPPAEAAGFEMSPGPKDDVLARYCLAIRRFGLHRVIRATGDNPFVFTDAAAALNAEAGALNADYAGYGGLPLGAGIESVDAGALIRAEAGAVAAHEREHVCPYLYGHPELFALHRPLAPRRWQDASARLTVDTVEDYRRALALDAALSRLENPGERYQGEKVIAVYHEIFPSAGVGAAGSVSKTKTTGEEP
ncbi:MAG: spore coat protein [Treponema sp.]|jgi:spore coat polysaccharide biosynthesis protein SpsF|nr:spore coat protein [Treponema sp.]